MWYRLWKSTSMIVPDNTKYLTISRHLEQNRLPRPIKIYIYIYSPLPERPRLSLRTINLIQSGMPVRKCISGEKSDIVLSNHNYGRRQIKAKWDNEEFGYFNTITKIANAILLLVVYVLAIK